MGWEIQGEEASIVLVGNFNPRIFHPDWFIRKQIVGEYDYEGDEVVCVPDYARLDLPESRTVVVQNDRFIATSSLPSNNQSLADLILNTFDALRETPVTQMGMNYNFIVKFHEKSEWIQFGTSLAPPEVWSNVAGYINETKDKKRASSLGLWSLTMNMPRPDELDGMIRPKIEVTDWGNYVLSFSTNNHVELGDGGVNKAIEVLREHWSASIELSTKLFNGIMTDGAK